MPNPRTPTVLKKLEGTYRPDRANPSEPNVPTLTIGARPPSWVKGDPARKAWAALLEVAPPGLITQMDAMALGLLVTAFGDWIAARAVLEKEGRYYETFGKGGRMLRAHPAVSDEEDAWRRCATLLGKFGMNPADRSRVSAGDQPNADPTEEFIRGRRGA